MILVTGASGFVGGKIIEICDNVVASPSLRGASEDKIKYILERYKIDKIIHTAAISDIGACEANPDLSYEANVMLPERLAKVAKNAKLICFSSDQVYGGAKSEGPYVEGDEMPNNTYAKHKLEMEKRVLDINPDAVMLRAEWMYGYYLKKSNYLMNVINAAENISFSSQQYRGLTYVKEVAQNVEKALKLPGGAYNFGSETTKSMYEITKEFLSFIGKNICLIDAPERHNLWMNCEKARKHGVIFNSVEDGLKLCANDCPDKILKLQKEFYI